MANQHSYIVAMFRKPVWREIVDGMWLPVLVFVCQVPNLYLAAKNKHILLGVLCLITMVCMIVSLTQKWARYSRYATGGPALWVEGDDFVVSVDKTMRIPVTDIQDYKFIVAPVTQTPLELKIEMQNGKTQRFPLEPIDDIAPLVGFMRRLVPGRS